MKKLISAAISVALLLTCVSAFAAPTNLLGQKIQGIFSVQKNGVKVADAIVVNGTSYVPVRTMSELAGIDLSVEGKTIEMSEAATSTPAKSLDELRAEQKELTEGIARIDANIKDLETNVIPMFEAQAREMATNGKLAEIAQSTADGYKRMVVQQRAEKDGLASQLSAVEAQIAAGQ